MRERDDEGERTVRLSVPEMDCPSCARKIETAIGSTEGVETVETRPTAGRATVTLGDPQVDHEALVAAAGRAGYEATPIDGEPRAEPSRVIWRSPRAITTGIGAVLLAVGMILTFLVPAVDPLVFMLGERSFFASHLLFLTSVALAGAPILRNGYYSARNWSLDIDFLMSAGIIGSVGTHHPFEGAMLAVLFSIAQLLERFSMDRARDSLRELMELSPETATVRRAGEERTVPVEAVDIGETVLVRPGEKVPLDGIVTEGESTVNQAPITGESVPVDKSKGKEVYAGTISSDGYLEVEVTSRSEDSTIARIVRLVEDAQREKTDREQFVDRFASYYTPIVVTFAIATAAIPPIALGWSWGTWFLRGLTLLVIACPCAFVISTPVSVVSGITSAAKNGVLIKGGTQLEAMGEIETVALDKTGTLTTGELAVTDVAAFDRSEEKLLAHASALERRSEHPIAGAIRDHAAETNITAPTVDSFESLTGKGVRAEIDGATYYAGKPGLFRELGVEFAAETRSDGGVPEVAQPSRADLVGTIDRLQAEGKTVVLVGTDSSILGAIGVADELRPEAHRTVSRLSELGVEWVAMLTGNNEGTAKAIAHSAGIEEFRAELLPEEKVAAIKELRTEGGVAMVGDGINDAPALATADVGIAMGAAGTDTALETADIALMGDELSKLPYLYALSRRANGVIRQNIWSSLGVKAVLAAGAPFGYVSVAMAVIVGDMGMSLGVTGNAMRLSRLDAESIEDQSAS